MGGDLNHTKSWNPSKSSNQGKVRKAEKKALEEKKKKQQLQKEREEERSIEKLKELQQESGKSDKTTFDANLAWMHQAPLDNGFLLDNPREQFLLGKRRVDSLLKTPTQTSWTTGSLSRDSSLSIPSSTADIRKKVAQDPLLRIVKARQQQMDNRAQRQRCAQLLGARRSAAGKDRYRGGYRGHMHSWSRFRSSSSDLGDGRVVMGFSERHEHSQHDSHRHSHSNKASQDKPGNARLARIRSDAQELEQGRKNRIVDFEGADALEQKLGSDAFTRNLRRIQMDACDRLRWRG